MLKAKVEAKAMVFRPSVRQMPKFWHRDHFGLEDLNICACPCVELCKVLVIAVEALIC